MSTKLTEENFNEKVLQSSKPVLIDFYADWCVPCQMLTPVIDEISQELDTLTVYKVNVDEQPALAGKFNVSSIPTLVLMKDGEPAANAVGVLPKSKILELIEENK